jgi:alkylhydroperoxidase/carboxymuconolactone decarboxylase family protein YurZ
VNDYVKGRETLAQLVGAQRADEIAARFSQLSPAFENEVMSVVFGRTWARDGMDARTRSLVSIGVLAALGRQGALRIVLGIALDSGATVEEITEALLHVGIYAGYPAAFDALPILKDVLDERGVARTGD